jgi:16S rRNA (cytidine1402-2'-O)-methyltransferase
VFDDHQPGTAVTMTLDNRFSIPDTTLMLHIRTISERQYLSPGIVPTKKPPLTKMKKNHSVSAPGTLYLVATPLGNLEDITLRALKILTEVDLIAAEDTRKAKKLLNHYQIKNPLTSYFEHTSFKKTQSLLSQLKRGKDIALISEAGTPSISDPGYKLTKCAIDNAINVIPIPGASALIAALSASGLPTHNFIFEGFIPRKQGKRKKLFLSLQDQPRTLIFYESPRRLLATLKDLFEVLGDRHIVIARELTKVYEEMIRGRTAEVIAQLEDRTIKGEITLLVSKASSS